MRGLMRHVRAFMAIFIVLGIGRASALPDGPILIGAEMDYPPYSHFDENGDPTGFSVEYAKAVARVMNLEVEFVIAPWAEIRQAVEGGEIDAVVGMYASEEREKVVDFAPPFTRVDHAAFVNVRGPKIADIEDLSGRSIIVMRGDIMHDVVMGARVGANLTLVDTVPQALRLLATGEFDCAILARLPALYWIGELGLRDIETPGESLASFDYCFAVKEGDQALLSAFAQGQSVLESTGEARELYARWLGVLLSEYGIAAKLLRLTLWIALPLCLALLLAVLGMWILRRTVADRTRVLSERERLMSITLDSIGDAVVTTGVDGSILGMNPVAVALTEWPLEEALGKPLREVVCIKDPDSNTTRGNPSGTALDADSAIGLERESYLYSRTGRRTRVADRISAIRDRQGRFYGTVSVFRDISEEHKFQKALVKSERRYRDLFHAMGSGFVLFEAIRTADGVIEDLAILDINPAVERITGLPAKDLVGRFLRDLLPSMSPGWIKRFAGVVESGDSIQFEELVTDFGKHFSVVAYRPQKRHLAVIFSDVSERLKYEARLRHLNDVLKSIRDANQLITKEKDEAQLIQQAAEIMVRDRGFFHTWIVLVDEAGRVTRQAQGCHHEHDEAVDSFIREHGLPVCIRKALDSDDVVVRDSPLSDCGLCPLIHSESRHGSMCMPLKYDDKVYGYMTVAVDPKFVREEEERSLFKEVGDDLAFALYSIGLEKERARNLEQLEYAKEMAESALRTKDQFLAVMSHEMRTPLNPIMGFSQLMQLTHTSEPDASYLNTIVRSAERLLELIDNLLNFVKLDKGSIQPKMSRFRLLDLCRDALRDTEHVSHGLDLRLENGGDRWPVEQDLVVEGEKSMLLQVLDNLLSNACKYTNEGNVTLTVSRDGSGAGSKVFYFSVNDTGIGIAPKVLPRLFKPFSQADSSYTRRYEGAGLGLAICKRLVEIMGGEIGVHSEQGKGSSFHFEIPMRVVSSERDDKKVGDDERQLRFSSPFHILVVEDNVDNVETAKAMIESLGGTCSVAMEGEQALASCERERFSLVLMDLALPTLDGIEVTGRLRASGGINAETPVIALTADVSSGVRKHCEEAGMQGYLAKPVNRRALWAAIEEQMAKSAPNVQGPDPTGC